MNITELINCTKHLISEDHFIFKRITFNNKNLIVYDIVLYSHSIVYGP